MAGWGSFASRDIPFNFNFGSVFHYLIGSMPHLTCASSDEHEEANDSSGNEQHRIQISISDPFQDVEFNAIKQSKKLRRGLGLQYVESGFLRNVQDTLSDRVHLTRPKSGHQCKQNITG